MFIAFASALLNLLFVSVHSGGGIALVLDVVAVEVSGGPVKMTLKTSSSIEFMYSLILAFQSANLLKLHIGGLVLEYSLFCAMSFDLK